MSDLVDICLEFVHTNMNQILSVTPTFSCVGDQLITRYMFHFSALYQLGHHRGGARWTQ